MRRMDSHVEMMENDGRLQLLCPGVEHELNPARHLGDTPIRFLPRDA